MADTNEIKITTFPVIDPLAYVQDERLGQRDILPGSVTERLLSPNINFEAGDTTSDVRIIKQDPAVFFMSAWGDSSYWMGVDHNDDFTDNDLFYIGHGSVFATSPALSINTTLDTELYGDLTINRENQLIFANDSFPTQHANMGFNSGGKDFTFGLLVSPYSYASVNLSLLTFVHAEAPSVPRGDLCLAADANMQVLVGNSTNFGLTSNATGFYYDIFMRSSRDFYMSADATAKYRVFGMSGSSYIEIGDPQTGAPAQGLMLYAGLATPRIQMENTGLIVINETGVDADIRIEGDTDANLFYLDAGDDRIGIGTATPGTKLQVVGVITGANFISNVAIGTAPYATTSTTVNTNLNADLLDGHHSSDFALSTLALDELSDVIIATPTVDQILRYNGASWVNGPDVTVNVGSGVDFFYNTTDSDIGGYDTLTRDPQNVAEQDITTVCNNNTVLQKAYSSPSVGLGGTQIDAGIWNFDIWAYANVLTLPSSIIIEVYSITTGAVETLLFTVETVTLGATISLYDVSTIQQAFTINPTDRLVVKVYGHTHNTSNTNVHFVFGGTTHYSTVETPLAMRHNDAAGLQGGTAGQYYHLTSAEISNFGTLTGSGATTLHKHDHGNMDGLGDDDHTIYLLAGGTRGLSGAWNAGQYIRATRFEVDADTCYIDRDGSNNMIFVDAVTGSKTLAELATGGAGGGDGIIAYMGL